MRRMKRTWLTQRLPVRCQHLRTAAAISRDVLCAPYESATEPETRESCEEVSEVRSTPETARNSSMTKRCDRYPMPMPPYSSETVRPSRPISPNFSQRSCELAFTTTDQQRYRRAHVGKGIVPVDLVCSMSELPLREVRHRVLCELERVLRAEQEDRTHPQLLL